MKLITWIVALCNRQWQKEFDDIMDTNTEDALDKECYPLMDTPTKEEIMEAVNSQPTHLSGRFKSRPRRKYKRKEVNNAYISD